MLKNIREKLIEQNGAVSLLVFITVLSFVTILTGAFITVTTLRKSRIRKWYKVTRNIWRRCKKSRPNI